jgi:hypothetical protein
VQATTPREPFADDSAGLDYFATDFHYEHLVTRLCAHLTATRGFVLISGTPSPDGELIERALNARKEGPHRATLVRCRPGMTLDAVTRAYGRQLGLKEDTDGTGQWALLSRLMGDSRKGVLRVLVLENADALDDRSFDELHRFTTLDDPHFLPVVLLTSRRFTTRLEAPSLQFLQPAIVAYLSLQHLESEEVAAFIRYQLNATDGRHEAIFTRGIIAAIAETTKGDPAAVNRLARQTAGIVLPSPVPPAPPVTQAPPSTPVTQAAQPAPATLSAPATPTTLPAPATPSALPAPSLTVPSRQVPLPPQLAQPALPPEKASMPEPRFAKAPILPRPPKIVLPLAPKSQLAAAPKALLPAPPKKAERPAASSAVAARGAVPPPPCAPLLAAATRESTMPRLSVSTTQRRAVTLGVTVAGYVLLAAGSAAGLFYWLGPATDRDVTTVAANAPQIQTVIAGDIPTLEPRPAPPAALEPPPPVPPAPAPVAAAPPLPVAPAPEISASPAPSLAVEKLVAAVEPLPPVASPPPVAQVQPVAQTQPVVQAQPAPTPTPAVAPPQAVPSERAARELAAIEPSASAKPPGESVAKVEADPAPLPPRAPDKPPSAAVAPLVHRGEQLLTSGDIASARRFFERAAEGGDAAAACGLGKSYDPLFLRRVGTRGVSGDAAKAADWYRRAASAGSNEAAARLAQLLVKFPQ